MTTTKSWNQVSTLLSEVLSSTLKKSEVDAVMTKWNAKKSEAAKLFGTDSRPSKAKKDPNAPKKARSGYIFFCDENREAAKVGTSKPTEVTSRLGEMWNALSEANREKYNKLALKDKERYTHEMASYTPPESDGTEEKPARRARGTKKERTGPRRPQSAYLFFCQDARVTAKQENPKLSAKDMMQELGKRWNALSEDQKRPYEQKQAADKARYESEKSSGTVEESKQDTKSVKAESKKSKAAPAKETPKVESKAPAKTEPKSKAKTESKAPAKTESKAPAKTEAPKAESKSKAPAKAAAPVKEAPKGKEKKAETKPTKVKETPGYVCFCDEQRDDVETEHPRMNARQVTEELNKRWLALSAEDRDAYEVEAGDGSEVEMEDD